MDQIESPRLRLVRMHDTSANSQHVQWLHQLWSDPLVQQWRYTSPHHTLSSCFFPLLIGRSLHGTNSTLQESQEFLVEHLTTYNAYLYCIFIKTPSTSTTLEVPGELIGQMVRQVQVLTIRDTDTDSVRQIYRYWVREVRPCHLHLHQTPRKRQNH
jgi:hypothetical protein